MAPDQGQKFELKHWIYLILLVGLLGGGILLGRRHALKLNQCSIETTAYLEELYKQPKKGYLFIYTYHVDGVNYTSHETFDNRKFRLRDFTPGDSIRIEYSCDDVEICRVKGVIRR
jgi:hypothetical protein